MAIWSSTRIRNTGWHINIAPVIDDIVLGEPEPGPEDVEEPSLVPLEQIEPECVPFLASRVMFLPVPSGNALRRMRFLPLPLQMLFR